MANLKNTYGLLTKREVKMAGYWPSSFFACLWTETKSRSINTQKRTRPISSHLDRTSLVNKGFIIGDKTPKHDKVSLQDKARIPSGQAGAILPARDTGFVQSQREIRFILPAHGVSHIINFVLSRENADKRSFLPNCTRKFAKVLIKHK